MLRSLLLLLLLTACATQPHNPPISLEDRFYQVAFFDEDSGEEQTLYRWELPFVVYVEGANDQDRRTIESLLHQISEATGLGASIVASPNADISVGFVGDEEWMEILDLTRKLRRSRGQNGVWNPQCSTHYGTRENGRETIMIAIPNSADRALRDACLAQELGHTTGLMNDTDWRSDTAFGGTTGANYLTSADLNLLRILYDPRLKRGMSWEEARPIVRQIIEEMGDG